MELLLLEFVKYQKIVLLVISLITLLNYVLPTVQRLKHHTRIT